MGCILGKVPNNTINDVQPYHENNSITINSMDIKEVDWELYNFNTTLTFSFDNIYTLCRVVDIYDGDTIMCAMVYHNNICKITIRLTGIDTCELKSKDTDVKDKAYEARQYLANLILKDNSYDITVDRYIKRKQLREILTDNICLINVYCGKFDKYGRVLGLLYNKNIMKNEINKIESYNDILVKNKLAYKYVGNTKINENKQLDILNTGMVEIGII